MSWDDLMSDVGAALGDSLGTPAVYTDPATAAQTTVDLLWDPQRAAHRADQAAEAQATSVLAVVAVSQLAAPEVYGLITRAGEVWSIATRRALPGGYWELELTAADVHSRGRMERLVRRG